MKRFLHWWFGLTVPHRLATTPQEREHHRYAQLISGFTLFLLTLALLTLPLRLLSQDRWGNLTGLLCDALYIAALVMNRQGWIRLAGTCCVGGVLLAEISPVLSQTGGLDTQQVALFDYLAIAILFAGALLPPRATFLVAFFNSLIIVLGLTITPHTPALTQVLQANFYAVLVPAMVFQVVVAMATYVIIRSLLTTIRRADRAEEIVSLQQLVAQHERALLSNKQQLEEGIQQIAHIHAQVANGNLQARVLLPEGHVLWPLAAQLNTLLKRAEHWKQESWLLMQTQFAAAQVTTYLQGARRHQHPIYFEHLTRTPLDSVLQEINELQKQPTALPAERS